MKRLSWKYIAGLVDGEGCIDMQVTKVKGYEDRFYIRPRVRVGMSVPGYDVLELLHANHGGHMDKEREPGGHWMNSKAWTLTGRQQVRPFLQNIVNHLIIKQEQARLAIWWLDEMGGGSYPNWVKSAVIDELKAMKRDPHRLSESAVRDLQRRAGDLGQMR